MRLLYFDKEEFLEVTRCRDRKPGTADRDHSAPGTLARSASRLLFVRSREAIDPASDLVADSPSCRSNRARMVKSACTRVGHAADLVGRESLLRAKIAGIALRRSARVTHDPSASHDGHAAGACDGSARSCGDPVTGLVDTENLNFHSGEPVAWRDSARVSEFLANGRDHLVARDRIRHKSSHKLYVQPKGLPPVHRLVSTGGAAREEEQVPTKDHL